jgi:hypothetical protein
MRSLSFALSFVLLAGLAVACGGGSGSSTPGDDTATGTDLGGDAGDVLAGDQTGTDQAAEQATEPTEPEDFTIVHGEQGRIQGVSIGKFDLWLLKPDGSEPYNLTGENLPQFGLTCEFGCIVDEKLTHLAVATGAPTAGQFNFRFGPITSTNEVRLDKGGTLSDVTDLKFASNYLFYSTRQPCASGGTGCQYKILRVDISGATPGQPVELGIFPPDDDPDFKEGRSTYQGHFYVSPDGSTVVVLSPTIRSMRLYTLKGGTLQQLGDLLCWYWEGDNCVGAGSAYGDTDPLAISNDSRWAVFFSKVQTDYKVSLYDLQNPTITPRVNYLMSVPPGSSINDLNNACANRTDDQFLAIEGTPRFTPDDTGVVFVGSAKCATPDNPRDWTSIYRIEVASIGAGNVFEPPTITQLIHKPDANVIQNVILHDAAMSPQGRWVVFSGTPMKQQDGQILDPGASRATSDREVYVLDPKTGEYAQLTNDLEYRTESVFTIVPR